MCSSQQRRLVDAGVRQWKKSRPARVFGAHLHLCFWVCQASFISVPGSPTGIISEIGSMCGIHASFPLQPLGPDKAFLGSVIYQQGIESPKKGSVGTWGSYHLLRSAQRRLPKLCLSWVSCWVLRIRIDSPGCGLSIGVGREEGPGAHEV